MEWCSRSLTSERPIKNIGENGRNNLSPRKDNNNARNDLLGLFVRYAWDDRDGHCSDDENIKSINWLKSTTIDFNNEDWDFSNEPGTSMRNEIEVTEDASSEKNVSQNTQNLSARITYARVACNLRKILPVLLNYNDDGNTDASGQTFLHIFLEEYLEKTEDFTVDQTIRMQRLVEGLVKISAPFYLNDAHGKTPLHIAATCKNQQIIKIIASCSMDVDARDKYGNTALHIVVDNCVNEELQHRDSYFDVVRTLVAKGADPNGKNKEGVTPVHLAAEKFHIEILRFFGEKDANFDERTNADELPLHSACKSAIKLSDARKMLETIDFLVSKSRVANPMDGKGFAPLHHAAGHAIVEVVERLIELGAKVDCRTAELQLTPLHLALESDRLDNARALVRAGADVEAEAADGSIPVFLAALRGSVDSLRFLIDEGADLSRREAHTGFALLHFTAWHEEKFELVVEKASLDVNSPGSCGVTPLSLAALSHSVGVVKSLVARGANVNFRGDESELSALHIAALEKNADIVKILIESGADVNSRGGVERMTPLHFAAIDSLEWSLGRYPVCVTGDIKKRIFAEKFWPFAKHINPKRCIEDVVEMLIEKGADVNALDATGKTPVHLASLTDNGDALPKILMAGAQIHLQDDAARLPFHNALVNNKDDAVAWLLASGADINESDTIRHFLNCHGRTRKLVVSHAIMLKCVGLPIAEVYEPLIREPSMEDCYAICREEARAFADYKDDDGFSFYDFLHMGSKRQYRLLDKVANRCGTLVYLNCARIVWGAYCEALDRYEHLRQARIAWYEVMTVYLPQVCVEHILSYLNNRTLVTFIASGQNRKKIANNSEEKQAVFECRFEG